MNYVFRQIRTFVEMFVGKLNTEIIEFKSSIYLRFMINKYLSRCK